MGCIPLKRSTAFKSYKYLTPDNSTRNYPILKIKSYTKSDTIFTNRLRTIAEVKSSLEVSGEVNYYYNNS